jgi:hypothetical protein
MIWHVDECQELGGRNKYAEHMGYLQQWNYFHDAAVGVHIPAHLLNV